MSKTYSIKEAMEDISKEIEVLVELAGHDIDVTDDLRILCSTWDNLRAQLDASNTEEDTHTPIELCEAYNNASGSMAVTTNGEATTAPSALQQHCTLIAQTVCVCEAQSDPEVAPNLYPSALIHFNRALATNMGMESDQNPHELLHGHPDDTRVALSTKEPVGCRHNRWTVGPTADDQVYTKRPLCFLDQAMASPIETLALPPAHHQTLALLQTIGRLIPTLILTDAVLELEIPSRTRGIGEYHISHQPP